MLQGTPDSVARLQAPVPAASRRVAPSFPSIGQLGRARLMRWYPGLGDLHRKPPPRDEARNPRIAATLERTEHVPRTAPHP